MRTIKMSAPESASGFSTEGRNYEVENGEIEVLESDVAFAESHGYTRVGGAAKPTAGRAAMVHSIASSARAVIEGSSDEVISTFLAMPEEDQSKFWQSMHDTLANVPAATAARKKAEADDEAAAEEAEKKRLADAAAQKEASDKAKKDAEIEAAKKQAEADASKKTK